MTIISILAEDAAVADRNSCEGRKFNFARLILSQARTKVSASGKICPAVDIFGGSRKRRYSE
jgi:hypothetical protein